MNLQPLQPCDGIRSIMYLRCHVTGRQTHWAQAVQEKWEHDANDPRSPDYYSPEGRVKKWGYDPGYTARKAFPA